MLSYTQEERQLAVLGAMKCGAHVLAACMSWDVIPGLLRHYSPFLQICLLLDDMVSRRHATIDVHDDAYYLMDRGSLNGCQINDVTVPAFVGVRLNAGDSIVIGKATYICMEVDERCVCASALQLRFVVRGRVTASPATSKKRMRSQSAQEGTVPPPHLDPWRRGVFRDASHVTRVQGGAARG
jgi:hypothetical protein